MRKIRIAQIGVNRHSHGVVIFNSLKKQPEIFKIVGYTWVENEHELYDGTYVAEAFAGYREMTLEEILNDPTIEAVTVECEETYLTKYTLMAVQHGKHVHMEKPGGTDLAQFEQLMAAAKQSDKVFHIGYMYRYNPYIMELLEQVRRGELGDIISVETQMNIRHADELREWLNRYPGGMMFFLGCHLIDLVLLLQGMPERIHPLNKRSGMNGIQSEDCAFAVLEYPHGVSFVKTYDVEAGGFARRQLVVTGTKGTVEIKPLEMYEGDQYDQQFTERVVQMDPTASVGYRGEFSRSPIFDRYDPMMASFAAYVRGKRENPYSLDYELTLYKTLLKCCGL